MGEGVCESLSRRRGEAGEAKHVPYLPHKCFRSAEGGVRRLCSASVLAHPEGGSEAAMEWPTAIHAGAKMTA